MANTDALEAIQDIIEAIEEYGSTIGIVTITEGAYNPRTGSTDSESTVTTKGIVNPEATKKNIRCFCC